MNIAKNPGNRFKEEYIYIQGEKTEEIKEIVFSLMDPETKISSVDPEWERLGVFKHYGLRGGDIIEVQVLPKRDLVQVKTSQSIVEYLENRIVNNFEGCQMVSYDKIIITKWDQERNENK